MDRAQLLRIDTFAGHITMHRIGNRDHGRGAPRNPAAHGTLAGTIVKALVVVFGDQHRHAPRAAHAKQRKACIKLARRHVRVDQIERATLDQAPQSNEWSRIAVKTEAECFQWRLPISFAVEVRDPDSHT